MALLVLLQHGSAISAYYFYYCPPMGSIRPQTKAFVIFINFNIKQILVYAVNNNIGKECN